MRLRGRFSGKCLVCAFTFSLVVHYWLLSPKIAVPPFLPPFHFHPSFSPPSASVPIHLHVFSLNNCPSIRPCTNFSSKKNLACAHTQYFCILCVEGTSNVSFSKAGPLEFLSCMMRFFLLCSLCPCMMKFLSSSLSPSHCLTLSCLLVIVRGRQAAVQRLRLLHIFMYLWGAISLSKSVSLSLSLSPPLIDILEQ